MLQGAEIQNHRSFMMEAFRAATLIDVHGRLSLRGKNVRIDILVQSHSSDIN